MFSLRRTLSTSARRLLSTAQNEGAVHPVNPLSIRPITDDGPPTPGPLNTYRSAETNPFSMLRGDSHMGAAYRFDCHSSRNNTITTLSSLTYDKSLFNPPRSQVISWFSGGSLKFKKGQRAGYEAGYQCAIQIFKVLEDLKKKHGSKVTVDLYFNGFGQGREALKTALMATEGASIRDTIKSVTDCTPSKLVARVPVKLDVYDPRP